MSDLIVNWDCTLPGMVIKGVDRTTTVFRNEDPHFAAIGWYDRKRAHADIGQFKDQPYSYQAKRISSDSCKAGKSCRGAGGAHISHGLIVSDQSTIQGEYQLVVPRYAVINEYIHDDTSILDGRWQHANTLPLPNGDAQRQAIGVWLFQSGPSILSVIARERSAQDDSDFLVGYEIVLDRTPGEPEEGDMGETAREGDTEDTKVIVEKVEVKKGVEVEQDARSGEKVVRAEEKVVIGIEESTKSRPDGGKHERVWVGPVRLDSDTDSPIDGVTGSAAFLLTNFDEENLFHLLVPRGAVIEHYTHSSGSILDGPWSHSATLPSPGSGTRITAVTFVQSSQGKFEAVARVTPPSGGDNYLVGYELDAVNGQKEWSQPFKLVADTGPIDRVTGSPTIIESNFSEEDRFELLVPHGAVTDHYIHAIGPIRQGQFTHFATLNPFQGLQVTAVSLVQNPDGGFEAVTRVQSPQGDELVIGYELKPGTSSWSGGVALSADDGPILAGKPAPSLDGPRTNSIG